MNLEIFMGERSIQKGKRSLPPKVKRAIYILFGVALCSAFVFAAVLFGLQKKDFDSETKNAFSMGTVVTARVYGKNAASADDEIISVIRQLDGTISWRVEGSAVDRVNSGERVKLNELAKIIATCREVSDSSGGAFDVTVGRLTRLWDFDDGAEKIPSKKDISAALGTVDYRKLSTEGGIVSAAEDQLVDLGSVGKGYACDMVRSYLEMTENEGAVVSVGGSILAYGKRNKAGDPWRIAVKHPREENAFLGTIILDEGFVSTSGDYEKYFEKDGKRYHHILDARTGYPAESDLVSVTIVAESGLLSDALSTACFILGSEKGRELAEKYAVGAVFVASDGSIDEIGSVRFEKS